MNEAEADTVVTEQPAMTETTPAPDHPFVERMKEKVRYLHEEINLFMNAEEGKIVTELHQAKVYLQAAIDSVKKHLIG